MAFTPADPLYNEIDVVVKQYSILQLPHIWKKQKTSQSQKRFL